MTCSVKGRNCSINLFFISIALLLGCEKIPTGVLDIRKDGFHITELKAPAAVIYNNDSSFTTSIRIDNPADIRDVWMDISYSGGISLFNHVSLLDNGNHLNADSLKGDNVFSAKVYIGKTNLNGRYSVNYFVNVAGETTPAAIHTFSFYNGQINYPPVISDLVMPDTVKVGESFVFTIKVFSPAGLGDIKKVLFKFIRPDGSVSDVFDMHDDGDIDTFGDQKAGDGLYSFKNSFSQAAQGQSRKFIFQAVSQNDSLSNIITHNIYVK